MRRQSLPGRGPVRLTRSPSRTALLGVIPLRPTLAQINVLCRMKTGYVLLPCVAVSEEDWKDYQPGKVRILRR